MRYIHIGFPKNFSTSLQRSFFPVHPQLFHLGVGTADNNLGYYDGVIESTLELYIKSCKRSKYLENREKIKEHFQSLFKKAEGMNDKKGVGISCEHLSFAFTMDGLDHMEKADRLFDIFGKDTKVFMIARNQKDLIRSLYRESLRQGMRYTYKEYIGFLYRFQDRNYVYDFCYDKVFSTYSSLFGKENVKILFFENYKLTDKVTKLTSDICTFLNIDDKASDLGHFNVALNDHELQAVLELNQKFTHDLGNNLYDTAEKHRSKKYFYEELGLNVPEEEFYKDVLMKRKVVELAKASPAAEAISFSADPIIEKKIFEKYADSNRKLEKLAGKLPDAYYF